MLANIGWLGLVIACVTAAACRSRGDADAPVLHETSAERLGTTAPGAGLAIGSRAPDVALTAVTGESYRLGDAYAAGPVFLVFYRGGWCPYCNLQLHELAQARPEFDRRRLGLVAISVDLPGQEAKTQAREGVPFPLLSDPRLVAHRAFNVVHIADAAQVERLSGYGIDLEPTPANHITASRSRRSSSSIEARMVSRSSGSLTSTATTRRGRARASCCRSPNACWAAARGDRRAPGHGRRENMPAWYSTISPVTAEAATVSGEAR